MRPTFIVIWIATAMAACSVEPVTFRLPPVQIGGTITGLGGAGLVLTINGGDDLPISGNGRFVFPTPVERGTSYELKVKHHPSSPVQLCSIANSSGTAGDADVTDVQVDCSTTAFRIGGTVTGLDANAVRLQDNGSDDLAVAANGAFTFTTPVPSGQTYEVAVTAQPTMPWQTCAVTAGGGTVTDADITNIEVACTTNRYRIGGTIVGLAPGNSITLRNNGGDDLVRSANGAFTFAIDVASGQPYAVTLVANPTAPISQTCTITNSAGMAADVDVTDVQVTCTTNVFTIGGSVTGLTGMGLVLQNNGGNALPINMNGPFTFTTPVASGATYSVTVKTQPTQQTCTVTNGAGTVGASNVTNVAVTCTTQIWSTSLFPIPIPGTTNTLGDLDLDNNGDLLVVMATTHALVRVNHGTGARATIASGIGTGSFLLGVAYRAANNMIYTNTDTEIFAVTPTGTVTPLLTGITGFLNAITIAPAGFGSFGGFIIGVTQGGSVVAVNPANGALTTITAGAGAASDLAFAPDGTLYISGGSSVRKVTVAGAVSTFATGFSSADGLTVTPDGTSMFIADSGTDTVRQVTIPGGVVTTFGNADIDGGFGVGGILAAPGNTLIVITGSGSMTLIAFAF